MADQLKPQIYRDLVDHLVDVCRNGQGQIGATRARMGLWNANATPQFLPEQFEINALLGRMPQRDRDLLAGMLATEVQLGVFETLKALHEFGVVPFQDGYEGSPFEDFVGRLNGWQWPES